MATWSSKSITLCSRSNGGPTVHLIDSSLSRTLRWNNYLVNERWREVRRDERRRRRPPPVAGDAGLGPGGQGCCRGATVGRGAIVDRRTDDLRRPVGRRPGQRGIGGGTRFVDFGRE